MRHIRLLTLAALPVSLGALMLAGSASAAGLTLTKISPSSAPEGTSIPVKIKGTGFDTTPGATTVSIGGEAAKEVVCATSKKCTAMTPEHFGTGAEEVTVTVGAATTVEPVSFTYETYSPPVVSIVAKHSGVRFSKKALTDKYPGIFDPGNVYLQIHNTTAVTQSFEGPTGPISLEPGLYEGYNFPVDEASPVVFTLTAAPNATLTVKTKEPR